MGKFRILLLLGGYFLFLLTGAFVFFKIFSFNFFLTHYLKNIGDKSVTSLRYLTILAIIGMANIGSAAAFTAQDFQDLAKKFNQTEWQLIKNESLGYIKRTAKTNEEVKSLKEAIDTARGAIALYRNIEDKNYYPLGKAAAQWGAEKLESEVRARFGERSWMVYVLNKIKDNPKSTKKLMKAALNGNSLEAEAVMNEALEGYAKSKYSTLHAQGITYWKKLIGEIIPGNKTAQKFGISPIDFYIQSLSNWAEFSSKARENFNRHVLDCLYLKYRIYKRNGSDIDAANTVSSTGLSGFKCASEAVKPVNKNIQLSFRGDLGGSFWNIFKKGGLNIAGGAAALGSYKLKGDELQHLLITFDRSGNTQYTTFSKWLDTELNNALKKRKDAVRKPLVDEQKRESDRQKKLAMRLMADIYEIMRRRSGQDVKDAKKEEDRKREEERELEKRACAAAKSFIQKALVNYDNGTFRPAHDELYYAKKALDGVTPSKSCPEVPAKISSTERMIAELEALLKKINISRERCDAGDLTSMIGQVQVISPRHKLLNKQLPQLERTLKAARLVERGHTQYVENNLDNAEKTLDEASKALEDTTSNDCYALDQRVEDDLWALRKLQKEATHLAGVLTRCKPREFRQTEKKYRGKSHRFYKDALKQLEAKRSSCGLSVADEDSSQLACKKAREQMNVAFGAYLDNKPAAASRSLKAVEAYLPKAASRPKCANMKSRIARIRKNLALIVNERRLTNQAISSCSIKKIDALLSLYKGLSNAAFITMKSRLASARKKCKKKQKVANCKTAASQLKSARNSYRDNRLKQASSQLTSILSLLRTDGEKKLSENQRAGH